MTVKNFMPPLHTERRHRAPSRPFWSRAVCDLQHWQRALARSKKPTYGSDSPHPPTCDTERANATEVQPGFSTRHGLDRGHSRVPGQPTSFPRTCCLSPRWTLADVVRADHKRYSFTSFTGAELLAALLPPEAACGAARGRRDWWGGVDRRRRGTGLYPPSVDSRLQEASGRIWPWPPLAACRRCSR